MVGLKDDFKINLVYNYLKEVSFTVTYLEEQWEGDLSYDTIQVDECPDNHLPPSSRSTHPTHQSGASVGVRPPPSPWLRGSESDFSYPLLQSSFQAQNPQETAVKSNSRHSDI